MAENIAEEILVTPQELKTKADEATNAINQMEALFGSLKNLVASTGSYWSGTAADRFRSMFREREDDVEGMLSRVKTQPPKLLAIAGIYETEEVKITEEHTKLPTNPLG